MKTSWCVVININMLFIMLQLADLPHDIELNIPQQLKLQLENDSFYIQRRNMASH